VGNLDTPFSSRHRTSRKNISKNILELNNIVDKMDLTEIYRVSHPTAADYTLSQQLMELYPKQITF
jgi:hypothetical protein